LEVTDSPLFRDVQIQRLPSSPLASDWLVALDCASDNEAFINGSDHPVSTVVRKGYYGYSLAHAFRVSFTAYVGSAETKLLILGE